MTLFKFLFSILLFLQGNWLGNGLKIRMINDTGWKIFQKPYKIQKQDSGLNYSSWKGFQLNGQT